MKRSYACYYTNTHIGPRAISCIMLTGRFIPGRKVKVYYVCFLNSKYPESESDVDSIVTEYVDGLATSLELSIILLHTIHLGTSYSIYTTARLDTHSY